MNTFVRLDALLEMFITEEGLLTVSLDELYDIMTEHNCDVGYDIKKWRRILRRADPPLKNVVSLLSDPEFLEHFSSVSNKYMRRTAFALDNVAMLQHYIGSRGKNMFENACRLGRVEIVKFLLADPSIDPSEWNSLSIRWATARGHTEVVRLLLADPRVDPTADNDYSLQIASYYGYVEIVKLLLDDPRVVPSVCNNIVFRDACVEGQVDIVKFLLSNPRFKLDVGEIRYDPRPWAVEVKLLLVNHYRQSLQSLS